MKNEEDPTEPVVPLFSEKYPDDDNVLKHIETIVYDHPQLLDDFSTDIVVSTERALWVPTSELDEPGSEERLYNEVYKADEEDIFIDELDDMTCLYTLVPGLQSFIRRTLPGARTWCQQTVGVRRFRDRGADMPRIYIDIRGGEADFIGFDGRQLLISTTHPWRDKMEIAYHLFNIMDVYGLDPAGCQVNLSGLRDVKNALMQELREHLKYVMFTMLPSAVARSEMPLSVAMLVSRVKKEK